MIFWIRFLLGFPARQKDIAEFHEAFPEFLDRQSFPPRRKRHPIFWWPLDLSDENLVGELKRWIEEAEVEPAKPRSAIECPRPDCPLKGDVNLGGNADEGPITARLMSVGGGPGSKPPKDAFLDLVRKSKKNMGLIKEVILTDPYIYSDVSEDGIEGGFDNLVAYLEALGLTTISSFTLKKTPSPKKSTKKSEELLDRKLRKHYPSISLGRYGSKYSFHDRFYIVRDDKGRLGGVFGPSLNGLSSNAIVLMGDIEDTQPLKKLSEWL